MLIKRSSHLDRNATTFRVVSIKSLPRFQTVLEKLETLSVPTSLELWYFWMLFMRFHINERSRSIGSDSKTFVM